MSDEDLMLAFQAGDLLAFEQLYQRHRVRLYGFLRRQLGQAAAADDLYQDIWFNLVQSRQQYQVRAKFSTYLLTLAHNKLIDYYRKHQRDQLRLVAWDADLMDEPSCAECELPEQRYQQQQESERLQGCLAALPESQREVFLLKETAELSLAEMALSLNLGMETVKSRLRYALNKLRQCLAGL